MSESTPKVNSHVDRLVRHLPVSAGHEQIYEEYTREADSIDIETRALKYLRDAIQNGASLIVLTGDAGHGKTHLCRRLIESHLGYSAAEARKLLLEKCDGSSKIDHASTPEKAKPLVIHKDLSELQVVDAVRFLNSVNLDSLVTTVICANEGRLRAIVNAAKNSEIAAYILDLFKTSFKTGVCSDKYGIHILNLNFQSTASRIGEAGSVLGDALKRWVDDSNRWSRSCNQCSLVKRCPIYYNRSSLSDTTSHTGERRKERLIELFAALERLNVVITIREMLMVVAYIITGGLVCRDVAELCKSNPNDGWQSDYSFFNLLFDASPKIGRTKLHEQIPVMAEFAKIDPGRKADRSTDDQLLNSTTLSLQSDIGLLINWPQSTRTKEPINAAYGIDDISTSPLNNKEFETEAQMIKKVVRALRRRAFFDDVANKSRVTNRIGFTFGEDFLAVLNENMSVAENVRLKNQLVSGLHIIQGLRLSGGSTRLHLVDPAFGRAINGVAIIARTLEGRNISILPMRKRWGTKTDSQKRSLVDSVDWIDRQITLRFELGETALDLDLNMMSFECINRAAQGYVSEEFYSFDLKRIRNFLGKIAEVDRKQGESIRVISRGAIATISIDQGLIQVSH